VAAALDAARRIADLSRRNADLDALNRVGELAGQATDLGDFFARASEVLRAAATCAGVAVFVLDEPTEELACAYADGGGPPGCCGEEALRGVLAARAPRVLALGAGDPGPAPAPGLRSVALLPLLVRSKAVGVLAAAFEAAAEEVGGRVELLGAVAAHLAAAVESHGAFRDVSRRVSDLEAVNALALRIFENAPGDQKALVEAACREVVSALSCRGAAVFLAEEDGRLLRGAGGFGVAVDPAGLLIDLARDGLARDAMARRAPTWSEDVTADPRSAFYRHPRVPPLAMVAVPLGSRGATTGLLLLADGAGRRFTEAELALAVALAGGLGVGLENAQLYGDARRRVEELSLLNEVGRTIAGSLDLDRVLREGADAARRLVGASRAFVVLYDPLRAELRPGADAGFAEADLAAFRGAALERTLSARVIRERRPLVVDDVQGSPEVDEAYRSRLLARSLAAAPVLLRGEPLGVLFVDETRRERRFAPADVDRVTAVANQLAVAIENARLYAEARGRLQELGTVIDVARVVSSSLDLEEVLGAGAEHLARTLGGSACTILLEDLRAQELRRAATRGGPVGPDRVRLDEPSLPRDALEARAPVTGRAPSPGGPDAPVLAVPLHVRDHPVGVALVAAAAADRVFGPGELARAIAIASQLAVAVDNARLYSETRRRAEELGLLHEVGRSLVATLDIERVLEAGVRNLARIVDAPDAYLALVGPDRAQAEICAVAGPHSEMRGVRLPLEPPEHNLASIVLHRREPLVIEDGLTDPIVNQRLRAQTGGRGYLALPLLVRDRTIGAIIITDPRGPRRFTPAEVERAAAIANQLAVAVENARLYEDLRRSYADLERAQRQLIQRERLAALGELAAIVAHEVRNPLGVIFNSLGSLRRLLRPAGDARLLLDIVGEEADRLNRIVGDLLDFARPSTPELRPEPLERVVEEAVGAALAQRPAGVEVRRELDASVPPVPMDARLVRQAVLNVAVNAIQAMPRGGRIVVRTRREGDAAILEIEDTGAGIPEEVRGRIFEPFFTTKASGTGLGLAVVKRIVEGHGGAVSVASRPGAGAIFALRFPLSPAPVEKAPAMG
jgi:GAF domain-containing protein